MSDKKPTKICEELVTAYWMEMETIMNYVANSTNLVGVRAEEIKNALEIDVTAELGHAQKLARRLSEIGGTVPGSKAFVASQDTLQPPAKSTNVAAVIKGVIAAEEAAIEQYNKIIRLCEGTDYVTQNLCITNLADEESHRSEFVGFLTEYEQV